MPGPKKTYNKRKARTVAIVPPKRKKKRVRKAKSYPLGRSLGSALGSVAGTMAGIGPGPGSYLGSALGAGAQSLMKRITGYGDYHVSRNSIVYNVDAVPEFSSSNERCTMVTHREFISDVTSSVTFNSTTFRINPARADTFPWLAQIARNYEQYVVQGLVFEYKTTSATAINSTNTGLGTVVMATQYNSLASPFVNKQQMENYEFSMSSVPSLSIIHPIECDPMQTQCGGIFNVDISISNVGDDPGDLRLYDIGRFTIATVGCPSAGAIIGELWVSYKICFMKPRLAAPLSIGDYFELDTSTITSSEPLGDLGLALPASANQEFVRLSGVNQLVLDPAFAGTFKVELEYKCSAIGTLIMPYLQAITTNVTIVTASYTAATVNTNQSKIDPASGDLYGTMVGYVKSNGGYQGAFEPTFAIGGANISGCTITKAILSISTVPYNFSQPPDFS